MVDRGRGRFLREVQGIFASGPWHVPCTGAAPTRFWKPPPVRCSAANGVTPERPLPMALPFGDTPGAREPRTIAILAKTIYRELRSSGFQARDVITLAGELLSQVTSEVRAGSAGAAAEAKDVRAAASGRAPGRSNKA